LEGRNRIWRAPGRFWGVEDSAWSAKRPIFMRLCPRFSPTMGDNRPVFASQNPRFSDYVMGRRGWLSHQNGIFRALWHGICIPGEGEGGFNAEACPFGSLRATPEPAEGTQRLALSEVEWDAEGRLGEPGFVRQDRGRTTPWQAADGVPPRGRRKQGRLRDPSTPLRSAQGRLRDGGMEAGERGSPWIPHSAFRTPHWEGSALQIALFPTCLFARYG